MVVLGIDLGANSTVLATVGKGGVAIVRNELADRLTPTLVSYTSKERLIGDSALSSLKSNINVTAQNFKYLLGAPSHPEMYEPWHSLVTYERQFALAPIADALNGFSGYQVAPDHVVTSTEVLAAFLKKMAHIGYNYTGASVSEIVVAVPSWFPESSRRAVLDAARIAELDCVGVMNHNTATALDYGLFRRAIFEQDKIHSVAFVDMGYSSCTCTVVDYTTKGLQVVFSQESNQFGGRALDRILYDYLAQAFLKKTGCDVNRNVKAQRKLIDAAEKVKKVLSANRETTVNLECLMEDEDLNEVITRETFEKMAEGFRIELQRFLESTLAGAHRSADTLTSIEICGGCTRIPFVQEVLKTSFGNRDLSRTISGDECVARGAAIFAAMKSKYHRVADFDVKDRLDHELSLQVTLVANVSIDKQPEVQLQPERAFKVFETGSPFPRKVVIHGHSDFIRAGQVPMKLGATEPEAFPYVEDFVLCFSDKQIKDADDAARNGQDNRVGITLSMDHNMLVNMRAEIVSTVEERVPTVRQVPKKNPETGEAIEGEFEQVEELETRKKVVRSEVKIERQVIAGPCLTHDGFLELLNREHEFSMRDANADRAKRLANEILSKCFDYRDKIHGLYRDYGTQEHKAHIEALTRELERWVEDNPDRDVKEYEDQYNRLESAVHVVRGPYEAEQKRLREEEEARRKEEARKMKEEAERLKAKLEAEKAAAAAAAANDENVDQAQPEPVVDETMADN